MLRTPGLQGVFAAAEQLSRAKNAVHFSTGSVDWSAFVPVPVPQKSSLLG